jgi:hypothetical protein
MYAGSCLLEFGHALHEWRPACERVGSVMRDGAGNAPLLMIVCKTFIFAKTDSFKLVSLVGGSSPMDIYDISESQKGE